MDAKVGRSVRGTCVAYTFLVHTTASVDRVSFRYKNVYLFLSVWRVGIVYKR